MGKTQINYSNGIYTCLCGYKDDTYSVRCPGCKKENTNLPKYVIS